MFNSSTTGRRTHLCVFKPAGDITMHVVMCNSEAFASELLEDFEDIFEY